MVSVTQVTNNLNPISMLEPCQEPVLQLRFAILFTVIVEIVPAETRAFCVSVFLFMMNMVVSGNIVVSPWTPSVTPAPGGEPRSAGEDGRRVAGSPGGALCLLSGLCGGESDTITTKLTNSFFLKLISRNRRH